MQSVSYASYLSVIPMLFANVLVKVFSMNIVDLFPLENYDYFF